MAKLICFSKLYIDRQSLMKHDFNPRSVENRGKIYFIEPEIHICYVQPADMYRAIELNLIIIQIMYIVIQVLLYLNQDIHYIYLRNRRCNPLPYHFPFQCIQMTAITS